MKRKQDAWSWSVTLLAAGVAIFAEAAVTSRSYVRQGLIAQYDGINNAGHDAAHNPNAATWVNLTGNTALNGTVDSNVVWGDDCWSVSANCKPITVGNALSQFTGTGTFTIQFAGKPQYGANSGRQCFFSQYNATRSFGIEHNGTGVSNCLRLYSDSRSTSLSSKANGVVTNVWGSFTVAADNGMRDAIFYKNLEPWGERHFTASAALNTNCTSIIGGEPYVGRDMAFRGTFNAFRVYDRVLTDEEIKINAAVDAVRFNNKTWADYPELACYSFAADGALQINLAATAASGGTVRLGDGAAAADVRAEYAYDGAAHSATFTAVADSGYVFCRWEGDGSAITAGSLVTPTVTVTSAKPVALTAIFKVPVRGATSRSYVQPGLVAQYDGIKNAGHDEVHSLTTNRWVDLTGHGNDGVVDSNVAWGEDGWSVDTNCKPVSLGNGISAVTATGEFTLQFACTPQTGANSGRQCFFSQYTNSVAGIGVEHNGVVSRNELRLYSAPLSRSAYSTSDPLAVNQWVQCTIAASNSLTRFGFYKNGNPMSFTTNNVFVKTTYASACTSVIGGEPFAGSRDMAFRGTYNAFRLYNRALTADEVMVNAAVDAIRFNGASGSSYTLSGGYSFADDNTLLVEMAVTATAGGKVRYSDGAAADSASKAVNQDGSECAAFTAIADEGYVFQGWTGDVDAIVGGTVLTEQIAVAATRPVLLTAVFRKPGNALDGMVLDLDIRDVTEDQPLGGTDNLETVTGVIGSALKAGASGSDLERSYTYSHTTLKNTGYENYRAAFKMKELASPATPATTNAAQPCIYLPQHYDGGTNCASVRWELPYNYVRGPVATIYVRFLWEGRVYMGTSYYNDCCIVCNGYTDWYKPGQGFVLRLRTPTNADKGYFNVFVPGVTPPVDFDRSDNLYVEAGRWVDCFVSVYPSPTNAKLSNVDIWFCQSSPLRSGGYFDKPTLKHQHLGDECGLTKFTMVDEAHSLRIGAEYTSVQTDIDHVRKNFRGYYAALKGWNRLLTEDEMWSVMMGQYGGTFNVGVENGSADEFGAEGRTAATFNTATDKWQAMKKSLTAADRTLTLEVPLTAENSGLPRVLEIVPIFNDVGETCPVTVAANGSTVGTFDLMDADKRTIVLRGAHALRNGSGKLVLTISRPEGCQGTLSFDAISLGGSWQVGADDNTSGEMGADTSNTSGVYVMGDTAYKHAQGSLVWSYRTLSLLFDVPKASAGKYGYRYQCELSNLKRAATPVRIELNGTEMWSTNSLAKNQVITLDIASESIKAGLNELKWSMDADESDSFISFDYHKLKMIPPKLGTTLILR